MGDTSPNRAWAEAQSRSETTHPPTLFAGSPVKRIGRDRFLRNVLVAAGNSGEASLATRCRALAEDPSPLVRGAAVWALSRLRDADAFERAAAGLMDGEGDDCVRAEWRGALALADKVKESIP